MYHFVTEENKASKKLEPQSPTGFPFLTGTQSDWPLKEGERAKQKTPIRLPKGRVRLRPYGDRQAPSRGVVRNGTMADSFFAAPDRGKTAKREKIH